MFCDWLRDFKTLPSEQSHKPRIRRSESSSNNNDPEKHSHPEIIPT